MENSFQVILGEIDDVSLAQVRVGVEYYHIDGVDIDELRLPRDERTLLLIKELIEQLLPEI